MKIPIHFIMIFFMFVAFACSSSEWQIGERRTIEGIVYVTGNDPFTKLALDLGEGNYCILLCSQDLENVLRANQGQKVKVQAQRERSLFDGFTVTVLEVVSPPQK